MGFRLLQLPYLVLQNIFSEWDPHELFLFSEISQKTKSIYKRMRGKPAFSSDLYYGIGFSLRLKFKNLEKNYYDFYMEDENDNGGTVERGEKLSILCENPASETREIVQELLGVHRCSLTKIVLNLDYLSNEEIKKFAFWVNNLTQKLVPMVSVNTQDKDKLQIFLKIYRKSTKFFDVQSHIISHGDKEKSINYPCQFKDLTLPDSQWVGLKDLMALDFVDAEFSNCRLTDMELNLFLKSWIAGKSHGRMEECTFLMAESIFCQIVFDGIVYEIPDRNKKIMTMKGSGGKVAEIMFHEKFYLRKFTIFVAREVFNLE